MRRSKPTQFLFARCLFARCLVALVSTGCGTLQEPSLRDSSFQDLPAIDRLPDLLTFRGGRRVTSAADWDQRREELKELLLYYQYGRVPPRPERVAVVESERRPHESGLGTTEFLTLEIDGREELRFRVALYLPNHSGPRPVIVREEGRIGQRREAPLFLEKGYIFIEYARHDLDPDRDRVVGSAQAAYPDYDWATLAVWAWCGSRLVDYLETRDDVDVDRIAITGHSRGGKMALLAAALDERFALVVPHQSGAGGAGCYRVLGPGAETLAQNDKPHWYHERIRWFGMQEERLPFDQHFLKALVAPRALLCTESVDDEFANPLGSLVTSVAAQEVFEFLGVPEKNGIHFRRGRHSTQTEDWQRLLEFAEWQFFGKEPEDRTAYWRETFPLPEGYDAWKTKPLDRGPPIVTASFYDRKAGESRFVPIGVAGNPADRDHHRQGRFGSVAASFEVSQLEVNHLEYATFLNAVATTDPAGLYHPEMEGLGLGAIQRTGNDGAYRYLVTEGSSYPIEYVSWFDAIRYCNWLHNGRPNGPQGPGTTEDGAYSLQDSDPTRKEGAKFFLPTESEWYKAAYFEPSGNYAHFPASSDRPRIQIPDPEFTSPMGVGGMANRIWEWT
ncbi:MAG: SUMF1/EgtB/PvdO family nonheme iron enzyme, partial [Planctomycetota bacterium]